MNNGTATKVELVMMPNSLLGIVSKSVRSKSPNKLAIIAKRIETPPRVKATG